MAFPTTKNINVFRFIKEIKGIVTLPIQEFERSSDIKGFISKQWADMFKNYLSSLRNERQDNKIKNSVDEMKILIQKIDIMLDSVGKNVLFKDNPDEYKNTINKQEILEFCNSIIQNIRWNKDDIDDAFYDRKEFITRVLNWLLELKEKDLLKNETLMDGRKSLIFLNTLDKYKIYYPSKIISLNNIEDKLDLLSESQNKTAIIETMVKDEYFFKLAEI